MAFGPPPSSPRPHAHTCKTHARVSPVPAAGDCLSSILRAGSKINEPWTRCWTTPAAGQGWAPTFQACVASMMQPQEEECLWQSSACVMDTGMICLALPPLHVCICLLSSDSRESAWKLHVSRCSQYGCRLQTHFEGDGVAITLSKNSTVTFITCPNVSFDQAIIPVVSVSPPIVVLEPLSFQKIHPGPAQFSLEYTSHIRD